MAFFVLLVIYEKLECSKHVYHRGKYATVCLVPSTLVENYFFVPSRRGTWKFLLVYFSDDV